MALLLHDAGGRGGIDAARYCHRHRPSGPAPAVLHERRGAANIGAGAHAALRTAAERSTFADWPPSSTAKLRRGSAAAGRTLQQQHAALLQQRRNAVAWRIVALCLPGPTAQPAQPSAGCCSRAAHCKYRCDYCWNPPYSVHRLAQPCRSKQLHGCGIVLTAAFCLL